MNKGEGSITVYLNGEPKNTAEGATLLMLINESGLQPSGIMIERNGEALLRSEWPEIRVAAGDRYEILRVVAGG